MLATGCATDRPPVVPVIEIDGEATRLNAACDGLRQSIDDLVDAVVAEGSDRVVIATEHLAVKYDAACP